MTTKKSIRHNSMSLLGKRIKQKKNARIKKSKYVVIHVLRYRLT